jgi:hypothetical protein
MKFNPATCAFGAAYRKFIGFMMFRRRIEANLEKIAAVLEIQPCTKCERATTAQQKSGCLKSFISRLQR